MDHRPWHAHYDYNVPTTIRYPRIPAQTMFQLPAGSFPDKACISFYGTEMTFWQVREQMLRMTNALGKLGVKKGDRVGIHLPNCPQFVIAYLATLSLGAIVTNLNPLYTPSELRHIMEITGMETLITFDMVLPNIRSLAKEVGLKRIVVTRVTDFIKGFGVSTAKDLELNGEEGWHHFSELIENTPETKLPRIPFSPDDPAMIQFTGGTTGVPKGALLTHANIVAGTFQASLWGSPTISIVPPERRTVLSVLPYFHVYGNIVAMNWSFFSCATQILVPRFEIEELLGIIGGFDKITFFPAVPTLITAVINHPKASELNLAKRLGLLNSGAAPMAAELIEKVQDMGIFFSEGFGMSESTSLGISNPILGMKKVGSIGIPFPDNDVRLVDVEEGNVDVIPGEPGEIIMKGPLIMKEYWNNPEETRGQLVDGWLHTGDIAVADEDGYIFIVDRKKDMIIAGGFNIYPREIDEVLYQHPKVAEAVSVGVPDDYRGETVKAFIVLKTGETATEKEIVDFCKTKLTGYKVPKLVEFRDALPKSAVGKILRKILREEEAQKRKKS
ncbi:MAG TPA: long-chain fatty acid--CoA ligase [Deltaproteobacteria bacterium]|mgnify:CR=1 FL=1|nr:long-chain fatty acid--CoA ligase [Deltaproteobacteria bacterium]HPR53881.1 long-chain fatty acid--CoA ligase [Deltaproteobacteria bacterium]HXK48716.1 long-chain fatty acid--CoA ligase [Deltaproteobacteria bacterium]